MRFGFSRHVLLLALVLLYAGGFRLIALDRPFYYDAEGASACQYGILARNYLRFEWARTRGMPVLTVGHLPTAAPMVFYPDHPPLVPLLIVPFYALFGVGEWQTRLPISMMTIAGVYLAYRLLARSASARAGVTAAAIFAATPMTLYFGGMPDVMGMPLILFILLSVLGYLRFHCEPRLSTFVRFLAAFVIAALCDWPAYVIVPIFILHFIATRPRNDWPWILAFGASACALFAAVYVYIALATSSPWTWILPLFVRHSAIAGTARFTPTEWLGAAAALNRTYHTLPLLVAFGLWLVAFGLRFHRLQPGVTVVRLLITWGIACMVIGSKAAYDHHFVWLLLTPGLAFGAALLVEWMFQRTERYASARVAGISVALVVVVFASWTALTTFRRLYPTIQTAPFGPMEMGQAIQAAAPDSRDLALVFGGDGGSGGQLWFYGDRAIRVHNIWSIEDVQERVQGDTADLVFNYDVQPWKATATGIVFPRVWEHDFAGVRAFLEQRYRPVRLPPAMAEKFQVFTVSPPASPNRPVSDLQSRPDSVSAIASPRGTS